MGGAGGRDHGRRIAFLPQLRGNHAAGRQARGGVVPLFAPYTGIPSNLLFFDRNGPTKDVWFYEHPLPEGRKNYTKTQPIQFEEFSPLIQWWGKRKANDRAWKVSAKDLLANGCNLDRKNPSAKDDITHLPPAELAASILEKEKRIADILGNIRKLLAPGPSKRA